MLSLTHIVRTTIVAAVAFAIARVCGFPESQWAPISAMVVTQSTVGAALTISGQRFAGTALGAAAGALLATYLGSGVLAFAFGIFALGLICAVLRLDRTAYRFAGITLAIVALVSRDTAVWLIAVHRFVEVSIGIAAGLAMSALWPDPDRGTGRPAKA